MRLGHSSSVSLAYLRASLQVGALVESVELGCDDDRVDGRGSLGAPHCAGEEKARSPML